MKRIHFLLLCGILLLSCSNNKQELRDGDLLFVTAKDHGLSSAINSVTQTGAETNYEHVAIVKSDNGSFWVLDASGKEGTRKISLNDFMAEQDSPVFRYRLKEGYKSSIEKAWPLAEEMLGKPYNFSYIWNDTSHYCSEFIYRMFAPDSIFELNPMTFKDPDTGEFNETWVNHYRRLNIPIPEGEPGCNPNGLAASDKLEYLGLFRLEETNNVH